MQGILRINDSSPLEDELFHVWRKALRGHGYDAASLAKKISLTENEITDVIAGGKTPSVIAAMADALHLSTSALAAFSSYSPKVPLLHGVSRLLMPFENDDVNAWLIREEDQTLLFDAGFLPQSCAELLGKISAHDVHFFLTHDHRDHVGGIKGIAPFLKKQYTLQAGASVKLGGLEITAVDLSGHCVPSRGYIIRGMNRTLAVVGDALFAGSIGGCIDPFHHQMALRNLKQHIFSLPPDSIILPGHGPATTVAQELAHNPFIAQ